MAELGLLDTNGILGLPWVRPEHTSAGLGWDDLYVSTQRERPYRAAFDPATTHLLVLHLNGPVTVRRGRAKLTSSELVPPGGLFLHPAGQPLTVELGGQLDTVHVYLADAALQNATDDGASVELAEELGSTDPLVEQLMLTLDGVVRRWEPAARTYVDHVGGLLAAHLIQRHSTRRADRRPPEPVSGLTGSEVARVREVMVNRLAEPLPLADLAAITGLSVSQFTRRFKAATGQTPHRFLVRLRVDAACRLLRAGSPPIAEVAAMCGFSHQEHLTRVMRSQLGTTPAVLRRNG
ncbi:MAG TPA: AraC family transcriptional regulator [Pseudonocardiaceae bacterium]|nr:AraC family transcriptional regulator [Pseudonocardiaceae bacterium]